MKPRKDRTRIYEEIDENLRIAYQQMLNEKLPQRFVDLIDQLRAEAGQRGNSDAGRGK